MLKKISKWALIVAGFCAALYAAIIAWLYGALKIWEVFGYTGLVWYVGATCLLIVIGMVML